MIVPLYAVAVAFSLVVLFCLFDVLMVRPISIRLFRLIQGAVVGIAANYYWYAYISNTVPSSDLRIVWVVLCVVMMAEIVSRQSWGSKAK
jgi:hypothetical protein